MSAEDLTAQCDCIAFGDWEAQAHQVTCALWENTLFGAGTADWDPNLQQLVLVHPIHQSLHDANEDDIGGPIGEFVQTEEPDEDELARIDFEDRCLLREEEMWEAVTDGTLDFPPFNYTIDGISRVFEIETCEWVNAPLGCHCDPPEEKACIHCGVYREDPVGSYFEKQWRPQIVRSDDIMCRCAKQSHWNCIHCGVRRPVGPVDEVYTEAGQLARPMERWDPKMATRKKKGGATAWSGFTPTGKTGKAVSYAAVCRHKGRELEFPNGKKIYGSSASAKAPEGFKPDFGIYLDSTWFHNAVNLGLMLPWADMGLPKLDRESVDAALNLACQMMDRGDIVEVGCIGGHGRTGTFLALVAMKNGVETPTEAIAYVREHYCKEAIESAKQEWYIEAWYAEEHGLPVPEEPVYVSSIGNHTATYQVNKGEKAEKQNDGQFIWYCPRCQADQDDDANECYWCLAEFDNPGSRVAEEWHKQDTPKQVESVAERIKGPWKVIEGRRRKPPTKAVTAGATATASPLPFEDLPDGWGGYF